MKLTKRKFRVVYTLTVTGTMEVDALSEDDAGEIVSEDTGYDILCECGDGLPEIEIEHVDEVKAQTVDIDCELQVTPK